MLLANNQPCSGRRDAGHPVRYDRFSMAALLLNVVLLADYSGECKAKALPDVGDDIGSALAIGMSVGMSAMDVLTQGAAIRGDSDTSLGMFVQRE